MDRPTTATIYGPDQVTAIKPSKEIQTVYASNAKGASMPVPLTFEALFLVPYLAKEPQTCEDKNSSIT